MTKHLTDPVPDARELNAAVSKGVNSLIQKMMQKVPDDRYQTPDELIEDIDRVIAGSAPKGAAPVRSKAGRAGGPAATAHGTKGDTPAVRRTRSSTHAASTKKGSTLPMVIAAAASAVIVIVAIAVSGGSSGGGQTSTPRPVPKPPVRVLVKDPEPAEVPTAPAGDSVRLQGMFDYAKKFAAENPNRFADAIRNFSEVGREGRGTKFSLMADEEISRIKAARTTRIGVVFDERKKAGDALAGQRLYQQAIAAIGEEPADLAGSGLSVELAGLKQGYADAAEELAASLVKKARELVVAGKYEEASLALAPLKKFGIPELAAKADAELVLIAATEKVAVAGAAARDAAMAREALEGFLDGFWDELGKRDYRGAGRKVKRAMSNRKMAAIKPALEQCTADVARIEGLWKATEESIRRREGSGITLHVSGIRRSGTVKSVRDGKISLAVRAGRGEILAEVRLAKIDAKDVVIHSDYDVADAEKRLTLALFLTAEGEAAKARQQIAVAKKLGADVSRVEDRLDVLERGKVEVAAEKAIESLRRTVADKKWPEAQKALDTLKETFGQTKAVAAASDALAVTANTIDDGLLAMGKVNAFRDFTLPDVYFIDSLNGDDRNDGKKWSTAFKSLEGPERKRLPPLKRECYYILRGRGDAAPYLSPFDANGRPMSSLIPYRADPIGGVTMIGVDDTGEVIIRKDPRSEGILRWAAPLSPGLRTTMINIRIEGYSGGICHHLRPRSELIGCRVVTEDSPAARAASRTIALVNASAKDPAAIEEARVMRDCLVVGGAGVVAGGYSKVIIDHCTIVKSLRMGFSEGYTQFRNFDMTHTVISDCLFADMTRAVYFRSTTKPAVFKNCYAAGVRAIGDRRLQSVIKSIPNAGFVNPAGGDYSLGPRSPLKGRAIDGTDVGYRPKKCIRHAMDALAKLQIKAKAAAGPKRR